MDITVNATSVAIGTIPDPGKVAVHLNGASVVALLDEIGSEACMKHFGLVPAKQRIPGLVAVRSCKTCNQFKCHTSACVRFDVEIRLPEGQVCQHWEEGF